MSGANREKAKALLKNGTFKMTAKSIRRELEVTEKALPMFKEKKEIYCTAGFTTGVSAMKQQFSRPKGLSALRYGIKPRCE
ncbi:MAG: hypothetical protein Pg6C_12890 [Treponemataceae bacterium]|nr:MAG: hypothetical protein Pg6C_12890 [Treponemataceae bacterium]